MGNLNGVAVDTAGNFYVADPSSNTVRKVTTGGVITTAAGNAAYGSPGSAGDGGQAASALLSQPTGVAVDAAGILYIADSGNNRIRRVAVDGTITTIVGSGTAAFSGDGGAGVSANLKNPRGVAADAAGNVYIADTGNHRVRKLSKDGTITTVAGNGTAAFSGDGGLATHASLNAPRAVAVDAAGNLYIADFANSRIRKVTLNGAIVTVAGNGHFAFAGDGGPGTSAPLYFPTGLAVDAAGNVYIGDTQNNAVRQLTPVADSFAAPVIVSGGVNVLPEFGGGTTIAPGTFIEIQGSGFAGRSRAWTNADFKNSVAPTILDGTFVTIGGQAAFLSLVSPDRIRALVPAGVAPGTQQLTVATLAGTTDPYAVVVASSQPALLAPASFNVGGVQYVSAILPDGVTYAAPAGAIPDTTTRPVQPGETVTLYGIGFGPVTPDIPVGQKALDTNVLNTPPAIFFGDAPATLSYAGLAPDQVGIYQFDVVVPDTNATGPVPLTFKLGDVAGTQTLYIEVAPATPQQ